MVVQHAGLNLIVGDIVSVPWFYSVLGRGMLILCMTRVFLKSLLRVKMVYLVAQSFKFGQKGIPRYI